MPHWYGGLTNCGCSTAAATAPLWHLEKVDNRKLTLLIGKGHSFCKQCLHNLQFKKTRYLSRHCLQNKWTLDKTPKVQLLNPKISSAAVIARYWSSRVQSLWLLSRWSSRPIFFLLPFSSMSRQLTHSFFFKSIPGLQSDTEI